MNTSVRFTRHKKGFSFVEVMITVSVIAILALIAIATITKVKPAAELSKLKSDVQSLNTAVKIYRYSGGDLSTTSSVNEVIAKLKTVRQKSTAQQFVGYTGSMLDSRTSILPVAASQKGPRAIYDINKKRFFVTTEAVPGFKITLSDLNDPGIAVTEETRANSALKYSSTSNWVWDYEDVPPPARLDPTLVTKIDTTDPNTGGPNSVGTPTPPSAPVLDKLLPPLFSLPSDHYDIDTFPMELTLSNPNSSDDSIIIYGVISEANWEWLDYTGPIQITPGDKVIAFIESLNPQEFHHSDPADEHYDWTATLSSPEINVSEEEIDARTGSTTVEITQSNNPDYFDHDGELLLFSPNAFTVQYKLMPNVPGQGSETAWTTYEEPFDVGGPQFPKGFEVVSKVVSNSPNFYDSSETTQGVGAFYKLDPPLITSDPEVLASPEETAAITLTNQNPTGSSELVYKILDHQGISATTWLEYSGSFPVAGAQYPGGFTIVAKSTPIDSYYRESNEANREVQVQFFGLPVTGKTIFVLDTSGSMSTNDRIGRLKDAAIAVLSLLNGSDQFAMIAYNSSANVLIDWGNASNSRKTNAIAAINSMTAGGGTLYQNALQATIDLNASGADQVIFLSDGYPNDDNPEAILQFIDTLAADGIDRFDTVSLGTDQPILETMAQRGRGKRVKVPDRP